MYISLDLGLIGSVSAEKIDPCKCPRSNLTVIFDGHTEWGVRVHVVEGNKYPTIINNAVYVGIGYLKEVV